MKTANKTRVCKACGSSSEQVPWVTASGVASGLLCRSCGNANSAARKANRRSDPEQRKADNLKSAEYMRRVRSVPERKAKLNSANAATMRLWRKKKPGANIANTRAYTLAKAKRVPAWANLAAVKQFYIACPAGLEVDHVIPLRGKLVSGLHCEANLQYLCPKENSSKGNNFDPMTFEGP